MPEFNKDNNCDLQCPAKTVMGIEARATTEFGKLPPSQINPVTLLGALARGELGRVMSQGARGAAQDAYAGMGCPARNLDAANWEPSERCVTKAQTMAAEFKLPEGYELTEREVAIVALAGLDERLRGQNPKNPSDTES